MAADDRNIKMGVYCAVLRQCLLEFAVTVHQTNETSRFPYVRNSHKLAMDPRVYEKLASVSLARRTNIHSPAPKSLSSSTLCYKKSADARAAQTACYIFRALPLVNQGIRSIF